MTETGLLKRLFHPNRISLMGLASSAVGTGFLFFPPTMPLGIGLIVAGYASDVIDGKIAKDYDMKTLEGAKLDPLFDKLKNGLVGSYVAGSEWIRGGYFLPGAIALNVGIDIWSQRTRGNGWDQLRDSYNAVLDPDSCHKDVEVDSKLRANIFGKAKTAIQAVANLGYIGLEIASNYSDKIDMDCVAIGSTSLLAISASLGAAGVLKRRKN